MDWFVEWFREIARLLSVIAEMFGAVVVLIALVRAAWGYLRDLVGQVERFPRESIRLGLGRSLVLALEFLLAADILRTAIDPTWQELARLAAIAAIRTVLNFFLDREIRREEELLRQQDGTRNG